MLTSTTEKYQTVLQRAQQLFQQDPDWVTFFREVLGVDGIVRQVFPSLDELTAFEKSTEFEQIQQWIVKLREKRATVDADAEPTRVITVRLPRSMHEYLKTEAHDLRTSMNKLCISKLLQVIEQNKIPTERSGSPPRRQTQPTPQPATATAQPVAPQPVAATQPQPVAATYQTPTPQPLGQGRGSYNSGF